MLSVPKLIRSANGEIESICLLLFFAEFARVDATYAFKASEVLLRETRGSPSTEVLPKSAVDEWAGLAIARLP